MYTTQWPLIFITIYVYRSSRKQTKPNETLGDLENWNRKMANKHIMMFKRSHEWRACWADYGKCGMTAWCVYKYDVTGSIMNSVCCECIIKLCVFVTMYSSEAEAEVVLEFPIHTAITWLYWAVSIPMQIRGTDKDKEETNLRLNII